MSYTGFFTASASTAGALTGLLFVALSVSAERLREVNNSLEQQAMAATAFTALIDALFVSLDALTPGGGTQTVSIIVGIVGLTSGVGLAYRMWRSRSDVTLSRRWPYLLTFIIGVYLAQVITATTVRTADQSDSVTVDFVLIMFAVGIARSWELLGLRGGGPLDLLSQQLDHRYPPHGPASGSAHRPGQPAPTRALDVPGDVGKEPAGGSNDPGDPGGAGPSA